MRGWCRPAGTVLALLMLAPLVTAKEPLAACRIAGIRNEVQCGRVMRPLDPAAPAGPQIAVHYVVVPAMARHKLDDPVFFIAGGPGQSAIQVAPQVLPLLARLNNRRDLVFVDQRGTGRSAPLECEELRLRPLAEQADVQFQEAQLRLCRERLRNLPHGDLRFYTTTIAMQDLDAVRRELGVERIDLVGVSYGTRAVLEYQRQFPDVVRRSVLDGVAPPDMVLPASFSTDGQAALEATLAACEAEPACARAYPGLRADWATVVKSLPRRVNVTHPVTGQAETFMLTRDMVLNSVRGPLYMPPVAAALPLALHEAARGRFEPLAGLNSMFAARRGTTLAMAMHFSVVCAEDLPRLPQSLDVPGADFGDDFARLYQRICAEWPRGEVAEAFYRVSPARAPALLLSGGLDPATPPRHAERVARALGPQARHVIAPNAGHGLLGVGCMHDVLFRFIDAAEDREALAVDAGCVKSMPRPPAYRSPMFPAEPPKK